MDNHWIFTILMVIISATYVQSAPVLYPYGSNNGDLEVTQANDGYRQINFTQGFPFYSYVFNKAYINENGLVSMLTPVNEAKYKEPFPISGTVDNDGDGNVEIEGDDARVLIAPFWANIDVTKGGKVFYRKISTDNDTHNVLERATGEVRACFLPQGDFTPTFGVLVTWDEVSFFGHESPSIDPRNTFQLVLVSDGRKSFAVFLYKDIQWNAGTEPAPAGDPVYGKNSKGAVIGFNVGDKYNALVHERSGDSDARQSGLVDLTNCPSANNMGTFYYKIDDKEMKEAGCDPNGDLAIFPTVGSMFGGEKIYLDGPCWDSSVQIECRFMYNDNEIQTVSGEREDQEKAYCIPDPFFLSGELKIEVSKNGGSDYTLSSTYYVANLDRISSSGVVRENPDWDSWNTEGNVLKVTWDPEEFGDSANVSIAALVYHEMGSQGPSWNWVYDIGVNASNSGEYVFEGVAVNKVYAETAFGAIRINETDSVDGRTLWSDVHMFGYLLNSEYQDDPNTVARSMCDEWVEDDKNLRDFVDGLEACPCTLKQAIVDTGRFQPDNGCSMFNQINTCSGEAKHCVISIAATDPTNSASQCCYNQAGDLMYAADGSDVSTADRSHVWGAEPYREAGMVPGLSNWYNDVRPWYFCCKWGDRCDDYLQLRPTPDCREYDPPKTSATFGDPHFVTFDGVEYTFNGKGEFIMLSEPKTEFELQVRTEQAECSSCENGTDANATVVTAIAMGETGSDTIHVELDTITVLKFVRRVSGSTEIIDFHKQEWLDFTGVSVIVVEGDIEIGLVNKATITYWNSGIGVNVTANGQALSIATNIPPSLIDNTDVVGLLGNWDGNSNNDLIKEDGTKVNPDTATPQQILDFGITWEVKSSLFYYEIGNHDTYQDNDFRPLFDAPDRSTLPDELVQDMDRVCSTSEQCLYDVASTRDIIVGEYTKVAMETHLRASEYTKPVVACPYLPTPTNGTKDYKGSQQNNLQGATVVFSCGEGLEVRGPEERTCQANGKWTGDGDTDCIVEGTGGEPSTNTVGIAVGVVIALLVVIVIVIAVVYLVLKKKREQDPETGATTAEKTKVKMSDVDDKPKDEPHEEEPLNLEEKTKSEGD